MPKRMPLQNKRTNQVTFRMDAATAAAFRGCERVLNAGRGRRDKVSRSDTVTAALRFAAANSETFAAFVTAERFAATDPKEAAAGDE